MLKREVDVKVKVRRGSMTENAKKLTDDRSLNSFADCLVSFPLAYCPQSITIYPLVCAMVFIDSGKYTYCMCYFVKALMSHFCSSNSKECAFLFS